MRCMTKICDGIAFYNVAYLVYLYICSLYSTSFSEHNKEGFCTLNSPKEIIWDGRLFKFYNPYCDPTVLKKTKNKATKTQEKPAGFLQLTLDVCETDSPLGDTFNVENDISWQ